MAYVKIEVDKEKNEIKIEVNDLNPLEVAKYLTGAVQTALGKFNVEPQSKILKPNMEAVNKLNQAVN